MSENYSNETIKRYTDALCNTFFNTGYFDKRETEKYIREAKARVEEADESLVEDPMGLALVITNNAEGTQKFSGIVRSVLGQAISTTLGIKAEYMERDAKKAITLYEKFVGEQFDKMFGAEGYRKLFTGNYNGLMNNLKGYMLAETGITDEVKATGAGFEISKTILALEDALRASVDIGVYSSDAAKLIDSVCYRAAKGREIVESKPVVVVKEDPIDRETQIEIAREELKKQLEPVVIKSGPKL